MVVMSNYGTIGGPEMASAIDSLIRKHPPQMRSTNPKKEKGT